MPNIVSSVKQLWFKAKIVAFVVSFSSLVVFLSGCSAVGINKPAALQVTSVPESAVFLDGKHLGKTPFYSDQIKSGKHDLKITASEAVFSYKLDLSENTLTVVNRELANNFLAQSGQVLSLVPGKGIFISASPQEVEITIDGKFIGKSPLLSEDISEGDHKILLTKDGYDRLEFSVKTVKNYQLVIDATLASQEAKGTASAPSSVKQTQKVQIIKTPQGFLRVRQDASVTSPEIGRVKDGDQLEVLQKIQGWVKISFEGKYGWISDQYTKDLP